MHKLIQDLIVGTEDRTWSVCSHCYAFLLFLQATLRPASLSSSAFISQHEHQTKS